MTSQPHAPVSTLAHLLVDLLSTAPALVPIYREHLALHDALLPDLFMAQVASWVSGTMHAPGAHTIEGGAAGEAARTLVGVMETHLTSGDAEVRELISLSFLDSVDASPANEVLRLHFGPSLRAEAARRDGWTES
ncbi:MAG TPA: hypothetical protein VFW03_00750 [Gemmatimonadaceae bacterium]|nr:hypothetical protein [Gemmatimonadaceae bacterium]